MKFSDLFNNINESSLSRVYSQYLEHDSGTISAFDKDLTKSENKERNRKLYKLLIGRGYSVTSIKGIFTYEDGEKHKEESFIVIDINDKNTLKNDLFEFGKYFNQECITFSKKSEKYSLIYTKDIYDKNNRIINKIGDEITLGKPLFGKDGENFSRVNGRPFVFEEFLNICEKDSDFNYKVAMGIKYETKNFIKENNLRIEI